MSAASVESTSSVGFTACGSYVSFAGYALFAAMSRATYTPLAEAWDSEWVTPLPSPMI